MNRKKALREHPEFMGSLCVNFHDDKCKDRAIMQQKPFSDIIVTFVLLTMKSIGHILN